MNYLTGLSTFIGLGFLIAFAVPFACFDRAWGSDIKIMDRSGHSLATVGALIAAVLAAITINPYAGAMCVAWPIYRSLNFSGGAMAPRSAAQALSALGRHLIATGLLCGILAIEHQGLTRIMLPALGYAIIATGLAVVNGATDGRYNWAVESCRGASYGCCVALALELA